MENNVKMNKKELVDILADKSGVKKQEMDKLITNIFNGITEMLSDGCTVSIPRFGKFIVYKSGGYKGRNPATGEPVDVLIKNKIKFKPSHILKNEIQE